MQNVFKSLQTKLAPLAESPIFVIGSFVVGVVIGVLGLLLAQTGLNNRTKIIYATQIEVVAQYSSLSEILGVTFADGELVQDNIYISRIKIWNNGRVDVLPESIRELTIQFPPYVEVRSGRQIGANFQDDAVELNCEESACELKLPVFGANFALEFEFLVVSPVPPRAELQGDVVRAEIYESSKYRKDPGGGFFGLLAGIALSAVVVLPVLVTLEGVGTAQFRKSWLGRIVVIVGWILTLLIVVGVLWLLSMLWFADVLPSFDPASPI